MRVPAPRFLLLFVMALLVAGATARVAQADPRADARAHYQAGVKAYSAQDYRTAIKEFSAAQATLPADLNLYNLADCYDKLGEADSAIQYYKEYLAKVPNTDKRVAIEASISRLEAAQSSAAQKKADEQKKVDDAAKADAARKAEEARKAEDARKAEEAKHQPPTGTGDPSGTGGTGEAATGVGSTGVPGTGETVSTGDAQLDRVAGIDVNQVRDQRVGGSGSGMPDTRQGPGGPNGQGANGQTNASVGAAGGAGAGMQANAGGGANGPTGTPGPDDKPVKKETPVYKKWWFWAVVAVSAYVVYSIAADGSSSNSRARDVLPPQSPNADPTAGTALFRF